jgi:hypothetical protein
MIGSSAATRRVSARGPGLSIPPPSSQEAPHDKRNTRSTRSVVLIPLNKLKKSPNNARKRPHSKADIEALAASIHAKGLLQNLVVEPEHDEAGAGTGFILVQIGEGRKRNCCVSSANRSAQASRSTASSTPATIRWKPARGLAIASKDRAKGFGEREDRSGEKWLSTWVGKMSTAEFQRPRTSSVLPHDATALV